MKDLKAASLTHQTDEFLNSLLKSSFDSNLRDESLDIDLSACVAIYNEPHQLNCGGLSSEFWRALDETAQSGLPDSVNIPTPKQSSLIKLEKKDDEEQECSGHETTKKVRKKREKEQPTKNSNHNNNNSSNQQITASASSIKKSDLENNENSSHKTTTSSKVPNNITLTKVETPFAEIFNLDNLESAGIRFKYKCDQCDEIMDSIDSLTKHETIHKHPSVKKHSSSSSKAMSKSKDSWQKCPDCGKRFVYYHLYYLKRHTIHYFLA